jgi:hypothetical protein
MPSGAILRLNHLKWLKAQLKDKHMQAGRMSFLLASSSPPETPGTGYLTALACTSMASDATGSLSLLTVHKENHLKQTDF